MSAGIAASGLRARRWVICTRTPALLAVLLALAGIGPVRAQSCFNPQVAPSTPTADFELQNDGTAVHRPSGLQWMRCSLGQAWTGSGCSGTAQNLTQWRDALQLVRAVNLGESNADGDGAPGFAGYGDWRMPNLKELASLHEACRRNPAINEQVFPNAPAQGLHWTSTTVHQNALAAWYFDFGEGRAGFALKSDALPRFLRLVRGGSAGAGYQAGANRVFADGFELTP